LGKCENCAALTVVDRQGEVDRHCALCRETDDRSDMKEAVRSNSTRRLRHTSKKRSDSGWTGLPAGQNSNNPVIHQ
jgi:hypothetical protein